MTPASILSVPESSACCPFSTFSKRGFTRAVAADQADPFPGLDDEVHVLEQRNVAEREMGVLQLYQRHDQISSDSVMG